jgi:hypothetical protein
MRFIDLNVTGGTVRFRYVISTPTEDSAETIVPGLPVVLFLHPVFIGQESFICKTAEAVYEL